MEQAFANEFISSYGGTLVEYLDYSIETVWNGGYQSFTVDGIEYEFDFNVEFVVGATGAEDHIVYLHDSDGRSDLQNWYLDFDLQEVGLIAAHEFGHMIGLYDEYVLYEGFLTGDFDITSIFGEFIDGSLDPDAPRFDNCFYLSGHSDGPIKRGEYCNSLMADLGPVQERYYLSLIEIVGLNSYGESVFGMAPPTYYHFMTPEDSYFIENEGISSEVPLPFSFILLILSIGSLITLRFARHAWGGYNQ